jgi:hypothetical protein
MITQAAQWYNENEQRAYPLSDTATQLSDTGSRLPTDILADMVIVVPSGLTGLRISALRITDTLVTISVVADQGAVLLGTYLRTTTQPYHAYQLTPWLADCSGWVVFGAHQTGGVVGDYRFATQQQSGLADAAIRYCDPPAVSDLVRQSNTTDQAATNLIQLSAGTGVTLMVDPQDPHNILVRLNPDIRAKLVGPCNQAPDCLPAIRRLNGVAADQDGIITLRFI